MRYHASSWIKSCKIDKCQGWGYEKKILPLGLIRYRNVWPGFESRIGAPNGSASFYKQVATSSKVRTMF